MDGIETLREEKEAAAKAARKKGKHQAEEEESEAELGMRVTRRGALKAFRELARAGREGLFEVVPRMWEGVGAGLLAHFPAGELPCP